MPWNRVIFKKKKTNLQNPFRKSTNYHHHILFISSLLNRNFQGWGWLKREQGWASNANVNQCGISEATWFQKPLKSQIPAQHSQSCHKKKGNHQISPDRSEQEWVFHPIHIQRRMLFPMVVNSKICITMMKHIKAHAKQKAPHKH